MSSEYQKLRRQHTDKFGVEPVVIGMFWNQPEKIRAGIAAAIKNNKPYNERDFLSKKELKDFDAGNLLF